MQGSGGNDRKNENALSWQMRITAEFLNHAKNGDLSALNGLCLQEHIDLTKWDQKAKDDAIEIARKSGHESIVRFLIIAQGLPYKDPKYIAKKQTGLAQSCPKYVCKTC